MLGAFLRDFEAHVGGIDNILPHPVDLMPGNHRIAGIPFRDEPVERHTPVDLNNALSVCE